MRSEIATMLRDQSHTLNNHPALPHDPTHIIKYPPSEMRTPQLLIRTHCLSQGSIPYRPFLSIGETLDLMVIKIIMTSFLCPMLTGVMKVLPNSKLHRLPSADDSIPNLSGLSFHGLMTHFRNLLYFMQSHWDCLSVPCGRVYYLRYATAAWGML